MINKILSHIKGRTRRLINQRHINDYAPEQGGWMKQPGPVLGNKQTGTLFDPFVRYENGRYQLYISDRRHGSIVMTESENGVNWGSFCTIIMGEPGNDWEEIVNRPAVASHNGISYLWYTGQAENSSRIGLATSKDGIHYQKYANNPILVPEFDYEKESVMNPCVLWDEEEQIFKMWYAAGETYEPDVICYAVSSDGIQWSKCNKNPILKASESIYDKYKVGGCDVHRMADGNYLMFYIGYQNLDVARICMAFSKDGITDWERSKDNPILSPSKNGWDGHAVYKPAACQVDGKWHLWYNGRKNTDEYIGLAIHEEKIL